MALQGHQRLVQFAPIALLGLAGVGLWRWSGSRHEASAAVARPLSSQEPTVSLSSASASPRNSVSLNPSSANAVVQRPKSGDLRKSLESRPPALFDPHTELLSDPLRQHRYAARAARAARLNQRLSQRIEELEQRLVASNSAEQPAIEAELAQLRANLSKRQELERAAIPAPGTRDGL